MDDIMRLVLQQAQPNNTATEASVWTTFQFEYFCFVGLESLILPVRLIVLGFFYR